jgi:hypothetical protein
MRVLLGVGVVTSTLAFAAVPASAQSDPNGTFGLSANHSVVDIATGPVDAACSFAPTVLIGPNGGLEFAVDGTATSSQPVQTLATNINCVVKTNYGSWGGASLGLPGPTSAAAGVSQEIPTAKLAGLRVCAYGSSFIQGGGTIASTPSAGC